MMDDGGRFRGLETEYGCLVHEGLSVARVVGRLRDWFFDQRRYGLIDQHERDWDEPPGNGGFLFNGGKVYEDMGHLECCTPECRRALDVVRYDRMLDRMLTQALRELELDERVSLIRNNVDHHTGATFGCHENYAMLRQAELSETSVLSLLAFLTLRGLYTGAGRVGGLGGGRWREAQEAEEGVGPFEGFQITQRADYVENDFFPWVQGNRAIINTRDEPLADASRFRRLHLLHGDTNVLPSATFFKLGVTSLVLDLLEIRALPAVQLRDPVATLKRLSYQVQGPWIVGLAEGSERDAVELLELYREAARRLFAGRDEETDAVLALWESVQRSFSEPALDPLVGVLDWPTKHHLLSLFRESEGLSWADPWLEAQDLEYHQVDEKRGLAFPLASQGYWSCEGAGELDRLATEPPRDTRALARSRVMRRIEEGCEDYVIDWDGVRWDRFWADLSDPHRLEPTLHPLPVGPGASGEETE